MDISKGFIYYLGNGKISPEGPQKLYIYTGSSEFVDKGNINSLGLQLRGRNSSAKGISRKLLHNRWSNCFLKTGTESEMPIKAGVALVVLCRYALSAQFGVGGAVSGGTARPLTQGSNSWCLPRKRRINWKNSSQNSTCGLVGRHHLMNQVQMEEREARR